MTKKLYSYCFFLEQLQLLVSRGENTCKFGRGGCKVVRFPHNICIKKPPQQREQEKQPPIALGRELPPPKGSRSIPLGLIADEPLRERNRGKGCARSRNEVHSSVVNTKGRSTPGEELSRDTHVFSLLLTSVAAVGKQFHLLA